jgi:hypothetical protein
MKQSTLLFDMSRVIVALSVESRCTAASNPARNMSNDVHQLLIDKLTLTGGFSV